MHCKRTSYQLNHMNQAANPTELTNHSQRWTATLRIAAVLLQNTKAY